MFLTRPSVSQSFSPVFLVSTTPLKPLNRISWTFVVMKDIMCRCAYPQEILIQLFDLFKEQLYPFWTLAKNFLCNSDESGFLSDCPSLMLGIAIHCIQHSQALEHGVCELAHSFFHPYTFPFSTYNPYLS